MNCACCGKPARKTALLSLDAETNLGRHSFAGFNLTVPLCGKCYHDIERHSTTMGWDASGWLIQRSPQEGDTDEKRAERLAIAKEWNLLAKPDQKCVVCGKAADVLCGHSGMLVCGQPLCLDHEYRCPHRTL